MSKDIVFACFKAQKMIYNGNPKNRNFFCCGLELNVLKCGAGE
jgi:hypothetical protein